MVDIFSIVLGFELVVENVRQLMVIVEIDSDERDVVMDGIEKVTK